jgi:hypothetical protein
VALDGPSLGKMLDDVAAGRIQLPDFQREWKWDDDRIRALLATVTLDYPLGVAMTLETGGEAQFKARPLAGTPVSPSEAPQQLLLDGQQRLTSLYQALKSDLPVETTNAANKRLKRWYYIDIAMAVDENADRDDAILSIPEERIVRGAFGRGATLDLTTLEKECEERLFPLNLVFDPERTGKWHRAFVSKGDDHWDMWAAFQHKVIDKIKSFQIPLIRLPKETRKDAVCSVFERVNTGGVVLNVFELLTATYAGNLNYATDHGKDFNLAEDWRTTKALLATVHPVFGIVDNGRETGLTSLDFLQAIALVTTYARKQEFLTVHPESATAPAIGCKRRDLLDLPLAEYVATAPKVMDAFDWVGQFLAAQSVFREVDLPYRTQLVPLAAIRVILGDAVDDPEASARLARWYWCGVLGELYGGSTDSRLVRDVEQVTAWIKQGGPEPDTIAEATFQEQRLRTLATRNSAAYKGIYALLIKQGAIDWFFTESPITAETLVGQYVDIRQVFPKAWFERNGLQADTRASSIVNKTPMSYRAGITVGRNAPSDYLQAFEQEAGTPGAWFDDLVGTHLIDPKALRADDFEAFHRARVDSLLQLVEEATGKPPVRERSGS